MFLTKKNKPYLLALFNDTQRINKVYLVNSALEAKRLIKDNKLENWDAYLIYLNEEKLDVM